MPRLSRFRPPGCIFRRLFLIVFAVCSVPLLVGLIEGVWLAQLTDQVYHKSLEDLRNNILVIGILDHTFSSHVGSLASHLPTGPFYIPQLLDPRDWWQKLGLKRFDFDDPMLADEISDLAKLDVFYRKRVAGEIEGNWHHWVYASAQALHLEGIWLDQWDDAFDQLLRYHYVTPPAHNASFHYIGCPGSFLCDQWRVMGSALIHFTTNTTGVTEDKLPMPGYEPVTVRVIDLPRQKYLDNPLSIPPGVFPSTFQQLLSITSSSTITADFTPYDSFYQQYRRLVDVMEQMGRSYPRTYGLLVKLEDWHAEYMGETIQGIVRLFGMVISCLFGNLFYSALTRSKELVRMAFYTQEELEEQEAERWSTEPFYDLFTGLLNDMMGELESKQEEFDPEESLKMSWDDMMTSVFNEIAPLTMMRVQ